MEDRFLKYSKLYIRIFLLFLSIPVAIGMIFLLFYGVSKFISFTYLDLVIELGIITIGPAVFSSAFAIFYIRTNQHPSAVVRILSKFAFVVGILVSISVLTMDIIVFFQKHNPDIDGYYCFTLGYLAGNIGGLFLIAIIQAFTTKKEVDWFERNRL